MSGTCDGVTQEQAERARLSSNLTLGALIIFFSSDLKFVSLLTFKTIYSRKHKQTNKLWDNSWKSLTGRQEIRLLSSGHGVPTTALERKMGSLFQGRRGQGRRRLPSGYPSLFPASAPGLSNTLQYLLSPPEWKICLLGLSGGVSLGFILSFNRLILNCVCMRERQRKREK